MKQRVDALIELRRDDPRIELEAKILENLRHNARRVMGNAAKRHKGGKLPTLYRKYRGTGFPLRTREGGKLPQWRMLSPWMKAQLATLALGERGYLQIKLHLHDDLRAELESSHVDLGTYLRDSLARHLKRRFDITPWFFFLMEDRTVRGGRTRPHAHGSIELRQLELPRNKWGKVPLRLRRIEAAQGRRAAQLAWGMEVTVEMLRAASGNGGGRSRVATNGIDQCRNLWRRRPYLAVFNSQWVDYAFKNARESSTQLSENRLTMPYALRREAHRLWNLIRSGEGAMDQWVG